jgi:hypothetical protein
VIMNDKHILVVTCKNSECRAVYELKPIVLFEDGGGTYSSDKDFCKKCESPTDIVFKDGRRAKSSYGEW